MLSLIGREIRDHIVLVLAPCVISALMIAIEVRFVLEGAWLGVFSPPVVMMPLPLLLFCVLGAAQMYGDRAGGISTLLGTLAATRNKIFAARVLVGLLTILATIVPLTITAVILLRWIMAGAELWYGMVAELSLAVVLTGFACYCVGLLVGWTTSRAWLLVGCVLLLFATGFLVYIKGFGPGAMVVLLLFIGAVLLRVWHKFTSASM